eukprot:scaffold287378_cov18-Tisochrysis_lutea.AAC.2
MMWLGMGEEGHQSPGPAWRLRRGYLEPLGHHASFAWANNAYRTEVQERLKKGCHFAWPSVIKLNNIVGSTSMPGGCEPYDRDLSGEPCGAYIWLCCGSFGLERIVAHVSRLVACLGSGSLM